MSAARAARVAGAILAAVVAWAAAARAQAATGCGRPDLLDTAPADGAEGIAPNASLLAHYAPSAEYVNEAATLEEIDSAGAGTPHAAAVTFDPTQGILTLAPDPPLAPDATYVVHWPALRAINAADPGAGADVHFTTGHDDDVESPRFDGVSGLRWDLERKQNDCTDNIEPRFVFDLDLADADDDGGRDALTLVVFQTASPAHPDQSVPVLTQAMPAPGVAARVALPVTADTVGRVCFAALARDLTGKSSNSGSRQRCAETTPPPFFRGCSVAPGAAGAGGLAAPLLGIAVAFAAVRRRPRRRRRPARSRGRAARFLAVIGAACGGGAKSPAIAPPPAATLTMAPARWRVPAADPDAPCVDVGTLRACWGADAPPAEMRPRTLPEPPPISELGWRCAGQGADRHCADRALAAAPFTCDEIGRCVQARPRMPDDGDWSCADMAGAAICLGGERAAGVAAAVPDPGWSCGPRREPARGRGAATRGGARTATATATAGESPARQRVCVDSSPDFPDGQMTGWRCRYADAPAQSRLCDRDPTAHQLGDACDARRPCIDGATCARGHCVPARAPAPECWLDSDCPNGACRFGGCRADTPPTPAPTGTGPGPAPVAGASPEPEPLTAWIVLDATAVPLAAGAAIRTRPDTPLTQSLRVGGAVLIAVAARRKQEPEPERDLTIEIDGACPVTIGPGELRPGAPLHRPLRPFFDPGGPRAPVGFGAPFSIDVEPGCPEARAGRIEWHQLEGPPLGALTVSDGGFRVAGTTAALADAVTRPPAWGVIPLSARAAGQVVLRALWRDDRGRTLARDVPLAAAARSRGLGNTPTGARVYLAGRGWRLLAAPPAHRPGAAALATTSGGAASFLPDVSGDWTLADGDGRELRLRTAHYDETPLDCGRAGCHADIARAAAPSPMTSVLARGLSPAAALVDTPAFGPGYPGCALRCHAVGEPGVADGGFTDVAAALGVGAGAFLVRAGAAPAAAGWDGLARPLRRLGGVGCMACHGPGAIPEPGARADILRADVCAVCHDAPPRYGHSAAWGSGAMARADVDPRTRAQAACARCHTTRGFLDALAGGAATARDDAVAASASVAIGLACATCHAVHQHGAARAAEGTPGPALLRATPTPAALAGAPPAALAGAGAVCLGCHAPDPDAAQPFASAAALWLGRGGIDPRSALPLDGDGPAPHAAVAGGCVGCHRDGPDHLERGAGHAFRASRAGCGACHLRAGAEIDARARAAPDVTARARRIWSAWLGRATSSAHRAHRADRADPAGPPHAASGAAAAVARDTPVGRALWDLRLVLEDPAAASHNAPYATKLLDAAEAVLAAGAPARGLARSESARRSR